MDSLVSANISSIVMIGLMIMIILLVLILVFWLYLFFKNYQPGATARFYGRRNADEGKTIIGGTDNSNNEER